MIAFVTGGTGFVGSHLVEELLKRGHEVRALTRGDLRWLAGLPVELVRGGLGDADALRDGCAGADLVYHVAGLTRAPSEDALVRANVDGTRAVLDATEAAGVRRVLVTSSQAAAGPSPVRDGRSVPSTEDDPPRPISAYGRSKAAMEGMVAKRIREGRGPDTVVVRPPSVYGPREADIYTLLKAAARGLFPIVGDGRAPQLALVYIRDLVRGMADAAERAPGGQMYFLGGPRNYSWAEVRAAAAEALGRRVVRLNVPRALVGPLGAVAEGAGRLAGRYPPLNREKAREARATWLISSEKARRDFGYRPEVDVREGMQETIRWYRAEGWL